MSSYPKDVQPLYIASLGELNTILIDPVDEIVSEANSFNGQHAYGAVLSELFRCDVIVEGVLRGAPDGPMFIHFSTPATTNHACNVPVYYSGVRGDRVRFSMTVDELRREVDVWDEMEKVWNS